MKHYYLNSGLVREIEFTPAVAERLAVPVGQMVDMGLFAMQMVSRKNRAKVTMQFAIERTELTDGYGFRVVDWLDRLLAAGTMCLGTNPPTTPNCASYMEASHIYLRELHADLPPITFANDQDPEEYAELWTLYAPHTEKLLNPDMQTQIDDLLEGYALRLLEDHERNHCLPE